MGDDWYQVMRLNHASHIFFNPGMRLLQLMGWRPGRGIGTANDAIKAAEKGSKWGTVSGVSLDNTPLYVLLPKVSV